MAVPTVATYSAAALIAAHATFRDLIDAGAGPGLIRVRNSADALLAEITLTDPCGTVNGTTGQLPLVPATQEDASVAGVAAYGEVCDSDGTVHLSLPAQSGTAAVSGYIVLNTLTLVENGPVEIISATIG